MGKYSLAISELDNASLIDIFDQYFENNASLKTIFHVALENRIRFPYISIPKSLLTAENDLDRAYIRKWCMDYLNFVIPSERNSRPKTSVVDPALIKIIESYTRATNIKAGDSLYQHNLWMSAENIQGELLEEYIARKVSPLGWIWCKGSVLRAIDFINYDGTVLLQIKNKFNTENSSSSAIRDGSNIKKWFRLGKSVKNGKIEPNFKWDVLNFIIDCGSNGAYPSEMSEEDYENFLLMVGKMNPHILD